MSYGVREFSYRVINPAKIGEQQVNTKCRKCGEEGLMWAKRDGKYWILKELDRSRMEEMKKTNKIIFRDHICKEQENNK
jgi:hypothetical protein